MAVDAQTGFRGGIHIVLDGREVHVAIAVHATGHLHRIARYSLVEVLVGQVLDKRIVQIVVDRRTGAKLEVGVLVTVDVLLEGLVIIQVSIIGVVGFSLFKFFLCHCRSRKAGEKHHHENLFHCCK